MRNTLFLSFIISGIVVSTGVVHSPVTLAGERQSVAHEHDKVTLPTKRLMIAMEEHVYNILEGILVGNFECAKQEANAVLAEANRINENFFPRNPEIDAWYMRSKDLDPKNIEAITKLKEEFNGYTRRIAAAVQEIQKAADAKDQEGTLAAFTDLIKNSCFECHRRIRDTK
ncbi:MAG: cytochrome c [Candidatus Brocadia sp.]|nr:cytochrome c [Candidatus Brocadia sp.]